MNHPRELRHQAAGHTGTLTDRDGLLVFKPALDRELAFYQAVQKRMYSEGNDDGNREGDVPLYSWMPTFLGTLNEGEQGTEGGKYIVLENLLHGFSEPNVMDVKLGKVLYDNEASVEKRERLAQVSKTTTSGSLGFRICGMKLKRNKMVEQVDPAHVEPDEDDYVFLNKHFGRSRTEDNIEDSFRLFFANSKLSPERVKTLKRTFLHRLQLLYNTLLEEEVRMVSCSLLFIYEGEPKRWDALNDRDSLLRDEFIDSGDEDSDSENESTGGKTGLSSLSLIDFAHSKLVPGEGYDEGLVDAIENLKTLFHNICIRI